MKKNHKPKFARMIKWSKWVDPFSRNRGDFEYVPEDELEPNQFDNDPEDRYNFEHEHECLEGAPEKVILTDFGFLKIQPFSNTLSAFNLWQADTNFNISEDVALTINKVVGVESLDIYTRYKFRVGIGQCFSFQEVRQNIENSLSVIPKKIASS